MPHFTSSSHRVVKYLCLSRPIHRSIEEQQSLSRPIDRSISSVAAKSKQLLYDISEERNLCSEVITHRGKTKRSGERKVQRLSSDLASRRSAPSGPPFRFQSDRGSPLAAPPGAADTSSVKRSLAARKSGNSQSSRKNTWIWQSKWLILAMAAMGILGIGSLLFFIFGVSVEEVSSASATVNHVTEGREVTFGSVIKLQHDRTKFRLHSHEVPYGSGSGQQSVTGFPGVEDANSYWIVRPPSGASVNQGDEILSGTIFRLQHMRTHRWLHSHLHQSPISGNYEVSAFGGNDQSDTGDNWRLEIEGKGNVWMRDQKVRLIHLDTGTYLHSHDKKYTRIVAGQQEVCGVQKKTSDNLWLAAEGVYFPRASSFKSS